MKKRVAVLDANERQRKNLCRVLNDNKWMTAAFESFQDLKRYVADSECQTVIINLDNISVSNQELRNLKMRNTERRIIALSVQPFHPELEEAFREHISVCIDFPVEDDELLYWLRIFDP